MGPDPSAYERKPLGEKPSHDDGTENGQRNSYHPVQGLGRPVGFVVRGRFRGGFGNFFFQCKRDFRRTVEICWAFQNWAYDKEYDQQAFDGLEAGHISLTLWRHEIAFRMLVFTPQVGLAPLHVQIFFRSADDIGLLRTPRSYSSHR